MSFYSDDLFKVFNEGNHSDLKKKCKLVAEDIKSGRFPILQLIEELRDLLVNPSPLKRERGVLIFTEVLQNLPYDFLDAQQIKTISVFYTEKLSDHHQIVPLVLKGVLRIIGFKNFPEEVIPSIFNALFINVACQQQQQADRYIIYEIFQLSLEKYKQALISMELNFVYGVISSIDGERDPRNLMFLFKWLKTFLTTISLGHLTEEMFEVIACYFPIDFKAPPSSMKNITREDLANELCPCLCAIPEFSEYCISLALEKLESSLQISKLDSLQLLREGCVVFSSTSYLKHATEIWSQLQKEVFSDVDDVIKMKCLNTLTVVVNKISQTEEKGCSSILSNIAITLKGNLLPNSKLFQPSISILLHTALASRESSLYITKEIVPLLINMFLILMDSTERAIVLRASVQFINACLKHSNENIFTEIDEIVSLPMLCLKASTEVDNSLRSTGFDCLADLAENLSLDIRLSLYKRLHNAIIEPEPTYVRISILKCLKSLSVPYPDEINNYVLHNSKITNHLVLNLYLNALCDLADLSYFKHIVTDCLIKYAIDDIKLAVVALKNMRNLLEKEYDTELLEIFLQKHVINKLIEYTVVIYCSNDLITELLLYISSILKILIGSQDCKVQNEIINSQINIVNNCYEQSEELYVLLMDGLISRVRKGLTLDSNVVALLTKISLLNSNIVIRDVSLQLLANLVNKHPNGDNFNKYLDSIKQDCLLHIDTFKSNVIAAISWITKALVMRNHPEAKFWTGMLLHHLEHDSTVAPGFKIIMNDTYESLSSVSYCNKGLLYQQKFFVEVTDKLCTNFSPGKTSYLIAVGYLIAYVPEQVLLIQFKKVRCEVSEEAQESFQEHFSPILVLNRLKYASLKHRRAVLKLVILCLEQCNDPEVLCTILKRINNFVINNDPILQDNLGDFLLRILKLTAYEHSMNVRIAALQSLNHFASLPLYRILPFKQKVLHQLGFCIDDKKRLVRKEAMETRTLWFLLDAPI